MQQRLRYTKRIVKTPWFWLIIAGYTLRILIMPITGQHDVMFMPWMAHFINQGHFNLYAFLYERFGGVVMHRPGVWAPYPYGFYALTASWLELLARIGGFDLGGWDSIWQVLHPARMVFLCKLIYLPFDLVIAYILCRSCGRLALALWAWTPAAIYTPFMMGQNDIYATAFTVMGVYAAARSVSADLGMEKSGLLSSFNRWAVLSSLFLGIGATFKIFPLLLLPPLALATTRGWKRRLVLWSPGLSIFGLVALPFITTPAYVNGVLLNPEGTRLFQAIQLFGAPISPFGVSYILLIGFLTFNGNRVGRTECIWSENSRPPARAGLPLGPVSRSGRSLTVPAHAWCCDGRSETGHSL